MLPKVQHYVPQFILRNFCLNENEQIYAFDKKTEKIYQTNIKNVAAESGFYNFKRDEVSFSAENNLGNLETTTAKLISKINAEESLAHITKSERMVLSIFIAAQIARVKQQRIKLKKLNDNILMILEKMGVDPNKVDGFSPSSEDEIKELTILTLKESIISFTPYILNKAWMLFRAPDTIDHLISDNPVTLQNQNDFSPYGNLGLAVKGIEIYFPISRKLSLGIFAKDIEESLRDGYKKYKLLKFFGLARYVPIPKEITERLENIMLGFKSGNAIQSKEENVVNKNSLQIMQSSRFIYSSKDDFSLVQQILREHPEYKEPPYPVIVNH